MKKILFTIFILVLFSIPIHGQNYKIPYTYEDCFNYANKWCSIYFNGCYDGRKYQKIWRLTENYQMHDDDGDYTFIQGKIYYKNYLDIPQTNLFQMKIYKNKVKFYKQSLSVVSGNWEWEVCTKMR
jgi:hypothetical protein